MKKTALLCGVIALGVTLFGCNGKGDKAGQNSTANTGQDVELALMFLRGAQNNDKKMMYEATSLSTAIVDDSRDRLIHQAKYKQSDEQRKATENVLRISGEVDYFTGKLRKLFPKSAGFQVTKTVNLGTMAGIKRSDHSVKITYNNLAEAVSDKTGKPVKVMIIHLQQATGSIDGRAIHSFSFDSKGFDRFVDKNFEVVSYF